MKLVVIGNGMVGRKLWNELMVALLIPRQYFSLRTGECRKVPEHSVQQGDDAHVLVR